jgi:hypothetical protein
MSVMKHFLIVTVLFTSFGMICLRADDKPLAAPRPTKDPVVVRNLFATADEGILTFPEGLSIPGAASLPKGAVHLTVGSDADARKTFTYFPYPRVEAPAGAMGVYRLEVNPQGAVAAITILKSMGSAMDVTPMKTFVQWRAKPGPLRIVDLGWQIRRRW